MNKEERVYFYADTPPDTRPPYSEDAFCAIQDLPPAPLAPFPGGQSVFPFGNNTSGYVMDHTHTRAIQDGISLAQRLLEHTKAEVDEIPYIIIDDCIPGDSEVDDDHFQYDMVRIAYRHVQSAGEALYRSEAPQSCPESRVTYQRHTFQLGVIIAHAFYQTTIGGPPDAIQRSGWEWERALFGGWIAGRPRTSFFADDGNWQGRVTAIVLRVPKEGEEGYYTIDNTKIMRIVEGRKGWEGALVTDDTTNVWFEGEANPLLRYAGPPIHYYRNNRWVFKHVERVGTGFIPKRSCGSGQGPCCQLQEDGTIS
jgi:hypothetical protein